MVLEGEHIEEKADFVDLYVSLDYKGNIEQSLQVEDVKRSIGDYSMYRVALDYAYAYDYVLKKMMNCCACPLAMQVMFI